MIWHVTSDNNTTCRNLIRSLYTYQGKPMVAFRICGNVIRLPLIIFEQVTWWLELWVLYLWLLADGLQRNMMTSKIVEKRKRQNASSIHISLQSCRRRAEQSSIHDYRIVRKFKTQMHEAKTFSISNIVLIYHYTQRYITLQCNFCKKLYMQKKKKM